MPTINPPDYDGASIVNLAANLELALGSQPPSSGLASFEIPEAATYVLVLFDGLGTSQLAHPAASSLNSSHAATLDAPFPTTTTVSLASIATALPPAQHGLLGYQLWLPDLEVVANTIKWTTLWGEALEFETGALLPETSWERLARAGTEPITVQPGNFAGSKLSQALYRGCRFEPAYGAEEIVAATLDLATQPGRLIFTYIPHVDFAAHVYGQDSAEYETSLAKANSIWEELLRRLPPGAALLGTADHGHVDFRPERQIRLPQELEAERTLYGDSRVMFVKGDPIATHDIPASWIPVEEMMNWWGPQPHHSSFAGRAPDGVLVANDDALILHSHSDERLIGHHGGLTDGERKVPLLVGS